MKLQNAFTRWPYSSSSSCLAFQLAVIPIISSASGSASLVTSRCQLQIGHTSMRRLLVGMSGMKKSVNQRVSTR